MFKDPLWSNLDYVVSYDLRNINANTQKNRKPKRFKHVSREDIVTLYTYGTLFSVLFIHRGANLESEHI